jgi:hypothetical protein
MKDDPKQDVADAALKLLASEEAVERLVKALAAARDQARWDKANLTAATLALRGGKKIHAVDERLKKARILA